MTARELLEGGFLQTSARYRMLGRVPPGKTAIEALYDAVQSKYIGLPNEREWAVQNRRWVNGLGERGCRSHYARVYARGADKVTVSVSVLREFRQLGGEAA